MSARVGAATGAAAVGGGAGPDVVVVGGGPVGLAAALEARAAGLRAVVVEPRLGPVDKACGEGLLPGALAAVQRLGVDPPGARITGIRYVGPGGRSRAEVSFTAGPGRGVRRTALHAALAQRAAASGVEIVVARVVDVVQDATGVALRLAPAVAGGGSSVLRAPWALAADGLHSGVRDLLGLTATTDGRRYAVRRHAAVAPWTDRVEVHWGPTLEAYVTPVGECEVGVAVEGRRGGDLVLGAAGRPGPLAELPELAERLAGARWTSSPRGAGPLRQRVRARSCGRVLLVGDAAGYVDALTGEGLRVGLASARAAVAAVVGEDEGGPRDRTGGGGAVERVGRRYARSWQRLSRDYRLLTSGLVTATRSPLVRAALVPTAAAAPGAFGAVVDRLAR